MGSKDGEDWVFKASNDLRGGRVSSARSGCRAFRGGGVSKDCNDLGVMGVSPLNHWKV